MKVMKQLTIKEKDMSTNTNVNDSQKVSDSYKL